MNKKTMVPTFIFYDDDRLNNSRFISWLERTTTGHNTVTAHTLPNAMDLISKNTGQSTVRGYEHIFNDYINKKFSEFKHVCMKDDAFDWIMPNDSRLCYFCWSVISRIRDCNGDFQANAPAYDALNLLSIHPSALIQSRDVTPPNSPIKLFYHELNQPTKTLNAKESVMFYIDALKLRIEQKDKLLGYIRLLYLEALKSEPLEDWLVKSDHEQLKWAEQYLKSKVGFVNRLAGKELLLKDMQSYLDVLYLVNEHAWKLNRAQMKKAWSQKKFRDQRTDKKQYNFNMTNDVGELLSILCKHEKTSKGDLIEALIREKYNHFSSIEKASQ